MYQAPKGWFPYSARSNPCSWHVRTARACLPMTTQGVAPDVAISALTVEIAACSHTDLEVPRRCFSRPSSFASRAREGQAPHTVFGVPS
jgi:hypothetical protein